MKKRLVLELKKHILIFAAGLAYFIWVSATNIYIPCIFNKITGLKCPGCGITHMIIALCHFDFVQAFWSNPFLFIVLPFVGTFYIINKIYYIYTDTKLNFEKKYLFLEYILLALTVIFGIARNIVG